MIYGEHQALLKGISESFFRFLRDRTYYSTSSIEDVKLLSWYKLKDPLYFNAIVNGLQLDEFKDKYRDFVTSLINNNPKAQSLIWGFKEVKYGIDDHVLDFLRIIYPEASFIFTVRNPVDVLKAKEGLGWWPLSHEQHQEYWLKQIKSYVEFNKDFPANSIIIRYEDFIDESKDDRKKLVNFVNKELTPTQDEIVFKMPKVGKSDAKATYTEQQIDLIKNYCLVPEISHLYSEDKV